METVSNANNATKIGVTRLRSKITPYGYQRSDCGYCSLKQSSISFGFGSESITVEDYEKLMLAGWRRSGDYFYRACAYATCCPLLTIRLEVSKFVPSKAQRQLRKRLDRFLSTGDVHVAPSEACNASKKGSIPSPSSGSPSSASKSLTFEMRRACFTNEVFQLYKKYQITVHKDDPDHVTEEGFTNFLIKSPLVPAAEHAGMPPDCLHPHGTFHQLHRLDGVLIAVGVVDLLPSGLSSVYLFYDTDYRHLVLGKYTALREIEYCQQHGLLYYYMGFYIHDCEKMKYKADYSPSELLCPTSLQWFDYASHISILREDYAAGYRYVPLESAARQRRLQQGVTAGDQVIRQAKEQVQFLRLQQENQQKEEEEGLELESVGKHSGPVATDPVIALASNTAVGVRKHPLSSFRAQFPILPAKFGAECLPLRLHGQTLTVKELREPGRTVVTELLGDLLFNMDTRMAWKMDVCIG